jgi:excisionase family DNA binding protein
MEKLVLTPREAAKVSGLGRDFVYEALHAGKLRSIRRGRLYLIPRRELERFVEEEANGSPPPE